MQRRPRPRNDQLPIGLVADSGSLYAVAVELDAEGRGFATQTARVPIPEGAVVGGQVEQPETVIAALNELWTLGGFQSRSVVLGLPGACCTWRRLELPSEPLPARLAAAREELEREELYRRNATAFDLLPLALPASEGRGVYAAVVTETVVLRSWQATLAEANLSTAAVEPLPVGALRLAASQVPAEDALLVAVVTPGVADFLIYHQERVCFQRRVVGEWGMPDFALPDEGEAPVSGGAVTLEQQAQFLHGEIRRSTAYAGRQISDLPRPRHILLIAEDHHDTRLAEFMTAAATPDTPVSCRRLEAGEALPLPLQQGSTDGLLMALGLALRSASAAAPVSHLNLVAPTLPKSSTPRPDGDHRWRFGIAAAVVLALNAGIGMSVRDVNVRAAEGAAVWKVLAETPTGNKSELGDRVRSARADALPKEAWPERWLALLGAVGSTEVAVTGMQLEGGSVTLTASAQEVKAVERYKRELEKYLPAQRGPKVAWLPAVNGHPTFTLTAGQLLPTQVGANSPDGSLDTTPNIVQVGQSDEASY